MGPYVLLRKHAMRRPARRPPLLNAATPPFVAINNKIVQAAQIYSNICRMPVYNEQRQW